MAASQNSSPKASVWSSTIGLKLVMALTGLLLVGFVVQHMTAHMQIFAGREAYNGYAHFMYGLGGILWLARATLLGAIAVHVLSAIKLSARNKEARPQAYAVKKNQATNSPALLMLQSGFTILAFVGYHIAHFTVNVVHTEIKYIGDKADPVRDVFTGYVTDFQNPLIFALYAAAMIGVSLHLAHAVTSMFRTLGVMRGKFREPLSKVGPVVGYVTGIGFLIPPTACLLGIVTL